MEYINYTIAEIILNFFLFLLTVFACTKGNATYMVQTPLLNSEDRKKNFQEDQEVMVESIPNTGIKESTCKGGNSKFIKCKKKEIQDFSVDDNYKSEIDFVELSDVEDQLDLSDLEDYLTSDECILESTYKWGMPIVELSKQSPEDAEVSYRHHYRSRTIRNQFSTYLYKSNSVENMDKGELIFTHQKGKESEKSCECYQHLDDSEHQASKCMNCRVYNVHINNPQAQERNKKVFSDYLEFDDELESEGLNSSEIDSMTSFGFSSFNCKSFNESIHISHNVHGWNQRIPPPDDELVDTDVNQVVDQICSMYEQSQQMSGKEAPNSTEYSEEKVRMWCPADPYTEEMINVDLNRLVNPCMYIHGQSQNFSEKQEKKKCSAGKSKKTWEAAVFPGLMHMEKEQPGKAKRKQRRRNKSGRSRGETRRLRRSLREIINWQISLTRNNTTMYDVKIGTSSEQIALHQMAHGASNFESSGVEDTNGHMFEDGPRQSDHTKNRQQENSVQGLPNSKEQNREGKVSNSACLLNTPGAESLSYSSTETLSSFFSSVSLSSVEEDETYHYEWLRLKTFSNWPLNSIFSTTLAKNGWVALGQEDQARCYSCHVVHGGWKVGDNPEKYHEPNCRFLRGQSSNVPIFREQLSQSPTARQIHQDHQQRIPELSENQRSLDNVAQGFPVREEQSETQTDSLSSLGASSSSPRETQETNIATVSTNHNDTLREQNYEGLPTTELVAAPTSRDNLPPMSQYQNSAAAIDVPAPQSKEAQLEALKKDPMGINFDRPKYPTYAILAVRISSFTAWPASMTQTPRDMAIAGFFYAGYGDYTRCFFCGGGLRNWEPGDDPWVEHARWFMKCAFVRQNRGQDFIELVQRRAAELEEQKNQQETGNTQPNTGEESAQAKEEKVMRSAAVTTIKEMGYGEERIKAAISVIKSRLPRGKHKVSAHDILEVIFELNQSESSSVINQSETVTEMTARNTDQSNSVMENSAYYSGHSNMSEEGKLKSANDPERSTEKEALEEAAGGNSIPNPIFDELTSLKMENTSLKDQILCKICMEKNVSIAFLPCGHLACCEDCSPAMRKCPICRQFVRGTVKTFLV